MATCQDIKIALQARFPALKVEKVDNGGAFLHIFTSGDYIIPKGTKRTVKAFLREQGLWPKGYTINLYPKPLQVPLMLDEMGNWNMRIPLLNERK